MKKIIKIVIIAILSISALFFILLSSVSFILLFKLLNNNITDYSSYKDYFQITLDIYEPFFNSNNVFGIITIVILNPVGNIIAQIIKYFIDKNGNSTSNIKEDNDSLTRYKPYIKNALVYSFVIFMIMGISLLNYGVCNAGTKQVDRIIVRIEENKKDNYKQDDIESNTNHTNSKKTAITFDINDPLYSHFSYDEIISEYILFSDEIKSTITTKISSPDKVNDKEYDKLVQLADIEYKKGNTVYSMILRIEADQYKLNAENVYLIGICLKDLADEAYRKNDLESAYEAYTSALSYNLIALQYVYTYTHNSNTKEYNSDFVINIFDRIDEILDAICLSTEKN